MPIPSDPERKLATVEDLTALRNRIDGFVQTHGPQSNFSEDTLMYDTGLEPPRPLLAEDSDDTAINLGFSGEFLANLAPQAVQRLEATEIIFSRDIPLYHYKGGFLPRDTTRISNEDIFDRHRSYGGVAIYVEKQSEARFASALYKLCLNGTMECLSDPRNLEPLTMSSEDPMIISQQELEDFNTILDALDGLSPEQRAQHMQTSIG